MNILFMSQRRQLPERLVDKELKVFSSSRILLGLLIGGLLILGSSLKVSAVGYNQYTSFNVSNSAFRGGLDCTSYGDRIYVHNDINGNIENVRTIDVYTVSIPDMSLRDETQYREDGTPNPNYQPRELVYETTISLQGDVPINPIGNTGIHVDDQGIHITGGEPGFFDGGGDVLHFDFDGSFLGREVESNSMGFDFPTSLLTFDPSNNTWIGANENREVSSASSTGGEWAYQFSWPNMDGGQQGDGMVFTQSPDGTGYLYVTDMTSDVIGQWTRGDNPNTSAIEEWYEVQRFDLGGNAENIEGMGFGALGHFWVTAFEGDYDPENCYLIELGGGDLGAYTLPPPIPTPNPVPEPSTLFLLSLGLVGLVVKRKLKTQ